MLSFYTNAFKMMLPSRSRKVGCVMKIRNCSPLYVKDPHNYHAVVDAWYLIVIGGWDSETAIPWAVAKFEADEGVVRTHWRAMVSQDRWMNGKYDQEPVRYSLVAVYGV